MNELVRRVGAKLKQHRQARGFSQAQLGDLAGSSEEWIRKVERGDGAPSIDMIEALSRALEILPGDLFEVAEQSKTRLQLAAELDALSPDEIDWLLAMIRMIRARPGRPA